MKITELAKQLGISRQVLHRHIKRGCPSDSLEAAIAWRERNLDFTQTKAWRIDGNKGVKYKSPTIDKSVFNNAMVYSNAGRRIFEKTLTEIIPNLYFERVDWLALALKDAGVPVTGKQVVEIQDNLFTTYLEELIYGHFQVNSYFELPPLSKMRLDSPERKAVIASLNQILSK